MKIVEKIKVVDVTITVSEEEYKVMRTIFECIRDDDNWSNSYRHFCDDFINME